jgi:hypothetical protein
MASDTTKIRYEVDFEADTSGADDAKKAIDRIEDNLKKMSGETRKLTRQTEAATGAQRDMAKAAKGLASAWKGMLALDIAGKLQAIANVAVQAFNLSRDWATNVQRTSRQLSVSLEDAAALQTSWALAGIETSEALGIVSQFQGQLLSDLEAQAEAQKAIIELDERRVELQGDFTEAQADHAESVLELEKEITKVGQKEISERIKNRDDALGELQRDFEKFIDEQVASERQETERLSDVWRDRVKRFQTDMLSAQSDLSEKLGQATSVREQQQIKKDFAERVRALKGGLADEQEKHRDSVEGQAEARQQAINDEKTAMEERAVFIQEKSDQDLERVKQRNAEQVESLKSRIEDENEAWADQQGNFAEGLADIDKAQAEALKSGGTLKFVVDELGVSMFQADGKMRPVSDLIFDIKERLNELPASAEKAAIIAELGWEDMAGWIEDGANATDSLKKAQEFNLIPTQQTLEAILKQNQALTELQFKLIGVSGEYAGATEMNEVYIKSLKAANQAVTIVAELYGQITEIIELLTKRINEGADAWANLLGVTSSGGVGGLLAGIQGSEGIAAVGGIGGLASGIGSFIANPAETVGAIASEAGREAISIIINGSVNGVDDLQTAVMDAIAMQDNKSVSGGR